MKLTKLTIAKIAEFENKAIECCRLPNEPAGYLDGVLDTLSYYIGACIEELGQAKFTDLTFEEYLKWEAGYLSP